VPIAVYGFTNVTSAQFTIEWDAALLDYLGLSALGLPDFTAGNFGTNHIAAGRLTVAWDDPSIKGVSLANGSVIFTVRLRAKAGSGGVSPVRFADSPTLREVTVNSQVVEFASVGGEVVVAAAPQPPRLALRLEGGDPVLTIQGTPGTQVEIQRAASLTEGAWTKQAEISVQAPTQDWTDATAGTESPWFYRLKLLP
jgi:hypothetical protein